MHGTRELSLRRLSTPSAFIALVWCFLLANVMDARAHPPGSQVASTTPGQRVVAVGDIHGAYDSLVAILREAGLVDQELRWSGGDTIFVQTGDFTDRGPAVRRCIDLLMRLQEEAEDAGGEMIVLLANHEIMNLVGVFRDAAPSEYEQFVDDESEQRREEAWKAWKEVRAEHAKTLGYREPDFSDEVRSNWEEAHPLGFVERVEAFGPDGVYGEWLRDLPVAAQVDDALFMHAGVSPELAGSSVEDINDEIWDEIDRFDEIRDDMVRRDLITPEATIDEMVISANDERTRILATSGPATGRTPSNRERFLAERLESIVNIGDWQLLTPEGYLWFRGFAMWSEAEGGGLVAEVLEKQQVAHIVVAHTTQLDGMMKARFDGGVFLIDTGMLTEHYGGRPSALEIVDGKFTAIYVGERIHLFPAAVATSEGR